MQTQLEHLRGNIQKDLLRRQAASGVSELEKKKLDVAAKQLEALIGFLEHVQEHGLETDAFGDLYDNTVTFLALNPVATVEFPKHLVYARSKLKRLGCTGAKEYLNLISKKDLEIIGIEDDAQVAREQTSFVAHWLTRAFR